MISLLEISCFQPSELVIVIAIAIAIMSRGRTEVKMLKAQSQDYHVLRKKRHVYRGFLPMIWRRNFQDWQHYPAIITLVLTDDEINLEDN